MMRALTLTQPWAGLVASGIKLIENRPRKMIKADDFGAQFAIHASRELDESVFDRIEEIAPELFDQDGNYYASPWYRRTLHTSAVIAVATLERMVERVPIYGADLAGLPTAQRRWFFGPIGYVLRDVVALSTPVASRGWQGFWTLPRDVEAKVREQLERSAA